MKVGIITFHNSYNCGSMMETFAIQRICQKMGHSVQIIDFSSEGQKELYSPFFRWNSIRNCIKNLLILPGLHCVRRNNLKYEEFKNKYFELSVKYSSDSILTDSNYDAVIAGSDQIWNITIKDYSPAYFLNWVRNAKKIAYAPSFGAKKISENTDNVEQFIDWLNDFDYLSIRENNGKLWLKEMLGKDVPILLDPTLLIDQEDYNSIEDSSLQPKCRYIFFYSPSFNPEICRLVQKVAQKYGLKVLTWSTKAYHYKLIKRFGFSLPEYESPSIYLNLIKNADLIFTTSYHGTIFSTIYRKNFFTIKNGDMFGNDDRVTTLLGQLSLEDRLIDYNFSDDFDYMEKPCYSRYEKNIVPLKLKSIDYLKKALSND